jgi:nucleotide-binding universal stress UspA family protein
MVPIIKKILFTTDLSENSKHAFTYAAALATLHRADIIMLHVMEESTSSINKHIANLFGEERWQQMQEEHKQTARDSIIGKRKTFDVIQNALASFSVFTDKTTAAISFEKQDILVREGNVIGEILDAALENHCDLIVMGSHIGLLGKTAVGGVTKGVLNQTKIPVLIVPPAAISG